MRITEKQLKAVIAEEVRRVIRESMMSDDLAVAAQDTALSARSDAYDTLAAALVDAGVSDIVSAMDMIDELESTASMGPLGAHAIGSAAESMGGDLEAAYMNIVDASGSVDEVLLADALGRLMGTA